jgi:hypothetical protein
MGMELNPNDSLSINASRPLPVSPGTMPVATSTVRSTNPDSFIPNASPRIQASASPFTLPPGAPPLAPSTESESAGFFEALSQQTTQVQQQALQQLGLLRQQMTNPLFMLSHGGVGNLLSMMFGNDKRITNANRAKTDDEDRIAEEVYFSLVEAERTFPTKRVVKPDGTLLQ